MSSRSNFDLPLTPRANWRILWPVALMLTIAVSSSQAVVAPPLPPILGFDKVAHLLVYGLLGTLCVRLPWMLRRVRWRGWAAVGVASAYGALDELYQGTTGRSPDIYDWIADVLGALVAVSLYLRWKRYREWLEWRLPLPGRRTRVAVAPES